MKFCKAFALLVYLVSGPAFGQAYQSYFTGNPVDAQAEPTGGICLMGGSTENDEAMRWFLRSANGGDVLVLRASGKGHHSEDGECDTEERGLYREIA